MPKAVIDTLEKALSTAASDPALAQRYVPVGLIARYASAEAFKGMIERDLKWLGDAVKSANLQMS